MRLSRPCYDKPWRCPGWAGGGFSYARHDKCNNGRMTGWSGDERWPHLSFNRCNACDVVTLPYVVRWLDPTWLGWLLSRTSRLIGRGVCALILLSFAVIGVVGIVWSASIVWYVSVSLAALTFAYAKFMTRLMSVYLEHDDHDWRHRGAVD